MVVWQFIQDQILGMKWLNALICKGLSAIGLDITGRVGGSIQFFLYDVIKITVLLCVLIFVISYIQSYFPPERCSARSRRSVRAHPFHCSSVSRVQVCRSVSHFPF